MEHCKAIILLCNRFSQKPFEEDSKVVVQAMQIKSYLQTCKAQNTRLIVQVLRQEGKSKFQSGPNNKNNNLDLIVCVEELKMTLLSKACLCPGLITFISNLIRSSGEPPEDESEGAQEWIEEYQEGMSFEIYKTVLSKKYKSMSFQSASLMIYKEFRALLFGLEVIHEKQSILYLNPKSFTIPANKKVIGYVIAGDKKDADEIQNQKEDDDLIDGLQQHQRFPYSGTNTTQFLSKKSIAAPQKKKTKL